MFVIPNVNVCIDFVTIHYKYTIIVNHYHPLYKNVILPITINKPCQFSFLMFLIHKYCHIISLSHFPQSPSANGVSFILLSSQGQLNSLVRTLELDFPITFAPIPISPASTSSNPGSSKRLENRVNWFAYPGYGDRLAK